MWWKIAISQRRFGAVLKHVRLHEFTLVKSVNLTDSTCLISSPKKIAPITKSISSKTMSDRGLLKMCYFEACLPLLYLEDELISMAMLFVREIVFSGFLEEKQVGQEFPSWKMSHFPDWRRKVKRMKRRENKDKGLNKKSNGVLILKRQAWWSRLKGIKKLKPKRYEWGHDHIQAFFLGDIITKV